MWMGGFGFGFEALVLVEGKWEPPPPEHQTAKSKEAEVCLDTGEPQLVDVLLVFLQNRSGPV